MRSFETSGLLCCGRNKESLCLNISVSGRVLALGLGFGLGFELVVPEAAWAVCVATPDCGSLGYTKTSCPGGGVKCPRDTSKMFCGCGSAYAYSCTGTGYSGGAGGACGGKYTSCTCENGYVWSGSDCCTMGDILFSDKTCDTALVYGKTAIGVVSYINGSTRLAIQLDNPGARYWSDSSMDIGGIPNYTDSRAVLNDFNGKSNTTYAVAANSSIGYAPEYCNAYSKGGVSGWYLPAAGELYTSVWTNKSAVNTGLSAAGGTAIVEKWHWSSSENTGYYAWIVNANAGTVGGGGKTDLNVTQVRCVLAF